MRSLPVMLWHCFWFARIALHTGLLVVIIRRRFYQQFPIFSLYTGWAVLKSTTLLTMNYAPFVTGNQYYGAFVVGRVGEVALSFGAIYEILWHVFRDYPALRDLGVVLFRWSTVLLLFIAMAIAWLAPAAGNPYSMSVFYVLERTANILLSGLLVFLFLFSRYFRLSWRNCAVGIALGLGVFATVNMATSAIRSQLEPIAANLTTDILTLIVEGTYLCCVLIWAAYLLAPDRERHALVSPLPTSHEMETWNQELERLLQP
jgi:hypothetical protein